jgi:hypothetical protein
MSAYRVMLLGAVLWAVAIILSATVLRGRVLGDWVEGFLLAAWFVYFSYWAGKSGRAKT